MKMFVMLLLTMQLAGCGGLFTTPLGELREHGSIYADKKVTVSGMVIDGDAIPMIGTRCYTLKDETGEFTVIMSGDLPKAGKTIRVAARLRPAAEFAGVKFGLHRVEIEK